MSILITSSLTTVLICKEKLQPHLKSNALLKNLMSTQWIQMICGKIQVRLNFPIYIIGKHQHLFDPTVIIIN